jgi:hypothetical protein
VGGRIALGLTLAGCATPWAGGREVRFHVRPPGPPWAQAATAPDQLAFRAPDLAAAMAVFEDCRAPEAGELRWVAHHLFFGLKPRELREQEGIRLQGLPAVRTRLEGRLDGAPVELEAVSLRHGGCLYDLVYVAPPDRFEAGHPAFQAVVQSFTPLAPR